MTDSIFVVGIHDLGPDSIVTDVPNDHGFHLQTEPGLSFFTKTWTDDYGRQHLIVRTAAVEEVSR